MIRPTAVAGTWYPASAGALTLEVDAYLSAAADGPAGRLQAIVAPHAGLMFSGPVGAYAYKAAAAGDFDVAVLVGPSHFVGFEGAALWPDGAFESPLGPAVVDEAGARALAASPVVNALHVCARARALARNAAAVPAARAARRADRAGAHRVPAPRDDRGACGGARPRFRRPPRAARRQHGSVALLRRRHGRNARRPRPAMRRGLRSRSVARVCSSSTRNPSAAATWPAAAAPRSPS